MIFLLALLLAIPTIYAAEPPMKYAQVVNSPYPEVNGKIAAIKGDAKAVWGIDNFYHWTVVPLGIPAATRYMKTNHPREGTVYYGIVDPFGYAFHESWLKRMDEQEAQLLIDQAKKGVNGRRGFSGRRCLARIRIG